MPAPIPRPNAGSATVDEQGNIAGGAGGGMKRINSDLLQQVSGRLTVSSSLHHTR